jgi:3-oxoacyl-[acyl-carrier-protein] synthase-3
MSVRHSITRTEGRIEGGMMPPGLKPRLGYPIALAGTGAALPAATLASTEIDAAAGKPQGWAQKSSGIVYRHVATSETVIELAAAAAERAIAAANIMKQDIDCIIAAGALPHQPIPTSAVLIQKALGLATSGVPAFDVNATCLGFMAALDVAGALITAGRYDTILITAADMPSHGTDWRNPELKAMFGDGAAAAIVRRSEQP